jgi:hypothetical protein
MLRRQVLEGAIRLLFTTRDLSQVRGYVEKAWRKILSGRVSVQVSSAPTKALYCAELLTNQNVPWQKQMVCCYF